MISQTNFFILWKSEKLFKKIKILNFWGFLFFKKFQKNLQKIVKSLK